MTLQRCMRIACFALLGMATVLPSVQAREDTAPITVSHGKIISMEYTLTLEDKKVIDSNIGGKPMDFTQGSNLIISGLEIAIQGMKIGESKQVTVSPEQGYGPYNPEAIQEVPIGNMPKKGLKVGAKIEGRNAKGRTVQAQVIEVQQDIVLLDYNHPMAGKTLYYEVKILNIQPASTSTPAP